MWFGLPSWARPNVDCVRMSRCCDMSEQGTTLFSLPKIALITQHPKKTQLQNCLSVYLFCVTPEAFGKCVSEIGVRVWSWTCLRFKKKVWIGNTLPPCPIEKCNIILVSLSHSKNGQVHCGYLYISWFGFTCNCVLCQILIFFCFCSQKVKANLYMAMSMNAWTWKNVNTLD